jgi:uncharacterized protein (TIGR01777 family)
VKIIVAGGTGFLGRSVVNRLAREGHTVVVLSRNPVRTKPLLHPDALLVQWDAQSPGEWISQIDGADGVINLTGEPMANRRWTNREKALILSSRVGSTRAIVEGIAGLSHKPSFLVNASAVGYYGSVEEGDLPEESPAGRGFVAEVCVEWEKAAMRAAGYGLRVVIPRMGVVLGEGGGALEKMMLPFRLFAGGVVGSGRQWFPWIHREDVIAALLFAVSQRELAGPVNFVAPQTVTMREFCSAVGKVMHRPSWTVAPASLVRLGLGEMADMLLTGQHVVPTVLNRSGYQFIFPDLSSALSDIVR